MRRPKLLPSQARQLAGKQFTLGAWMWASRQVDVRSPELYVFARGKGYSNTITLTTEPQFFAFSTLLGRDVGLLAWVGPLVAVILLFISYRVWLFGLRHYTSTGT